MPGVSKRSLCSKLGNGHRSKNIRSGVRNIRPGEGIFQVRVQHSKVGSRFRGRLLKFQPGVEYMKPGYGGGPPGAGLENLEPGLETFATDGTAYGRWQNGLAAQRSAAIY